MISEISIRKLSNDIARKFNPEKIVLFGSYAYGDPTQDSDVDMLIVTRFTGRAVDKSVEIRLKTNPKFPVDFLIYTPEKLADRISIGDTIITEILEKGKVLYEANNTGMDK